jgi:hypothetical protein
VIPILDTFEDIKECLGAAAVELPTAHDFVDDKPVAGGERTEALNIWSLDQSNLSSGTDVAGVHFRPLSSSDSLLHEAGAVPPKWGGRQDLYHQLHRENEKPLVDILKMHGYSGDILDLLKDAGYTHEIDTIWKYCSNTKLPDFETGEGILSRRQSCWLYDDQSTHEITLPGRNHAASQLRGPLTAVSLYRELLKKKRDLPQDESDPDADRRLIYVCGLDPVSIYALIGTTSPMRLPHLLHAIVAHLSFRCSVKLQLPSTGHPDFRLTFHLPYYTWRSSTRPPDSGSTLTKKGRQAADVSFLFQDHSEMCFIQEEHIAFVVSGYSSSKWVAYCFADSYFDGPSSGSSSVRTSSNTHPAYTSEIGASLWDPVEYFHEVVSTHLDQVDREWTYIYGKIQPALAVNVSDCIAITLLSF